MARKRKISSFDDVASNNDINSNDNNKNDVINDILEGKKTKDQTHIFKGYYLEREVANAIDRITEGRPKGTKSDLVNHIIKNYLTDEGIL